MTRTVTQNGTTLMTTGETTVPTILSGAPVGIIRVFTTGRPEDVDMPDIRKVARSAAQRHHGFGSVGANPVPIPAKFNGVKGLTWEFTPVTKRTTAAPAVAPAAPAARKARKAPAVATAAGPVAREVVAAIAATLGVDLETAAAIVRDAGARTTAAPAARKTTAKKDRPAFLGKRDGVVCEPCQDYGVVRKAGARAGGAYKTAGGAATAVANGNAVPCPRHVTAAPAVAKKAKKAKRSA